MDGNIPITSDHDFVLVVAGFADTIELIIYDLLFFFFLLLLRLVCRLGRRRHDRR